MSRLVWVGVLIALTPAPAPAQDSATDLYEARVRPLLIEHCYACHSRKAEKVKGDLRLDDLKPDFSTDAGRRQWLSVLERVSSGEMPPKGKPRAPEDGVRVLTRWIRDGAAAADLARRSTQGRVVCRRLNRVEYENSVRDLLGVDVELKDLLPPDTQAHGFDNVGEALHVSSFHLEKYLEAADVALGVAIANGPPPPTIKKRYTFHNEMQVKTATERVYRKTDDAVVIFSSSAWNAITVYQFYPPDRGRYRFRISASGYQSEGKPVVYRVDAGSMQMGGRPSHLVSYFDAPPDEPAVVEFYETFEPHSTLRITPYGLAGAQTVDKIGADVWAGPGLALQWVDVEGPLCDPWPPASHTRLFGDLPQSTVVGKRLEVVSKAPIEDATRILKTFTRRAFRRAVKEDDVTPYLALVQAALDQNRSFEQAVRIGLQAVLVSPEFLFLREKPGPLDDFALASRLSYFLWSTMPDEDLLALAEQGTLHKPDVLRGQVDRLLAHPKAAAFTENFVGQWLGLRDIDFTLPSHILYPEYDEMLKASMVKETEVTFAEILKNDLSLTSFVAADFTMLNGRLARHYGIPGVDGWEFRKTTLPPESHRGGVLTMASVLKVTANGTSTSPILRGAWVLERILGTPPPRPPADIPAVEPDIRGATTIREQLAKHRQLASCATCHSKIDPPGFALENFDVIGGWRENYRTSGRGQTVMIQGSRMPYLKGPKVEAGDVMPTGERFRDIDEFKQLLLKDKDGLARALARKLLTYATGGPAEAADQADLDAVVGAVRARNYGFRTLVHEIVQSPLFRNK
jgi:mono/diheme cytochrome c family protein